MALQRWGERCLRADNTSVIVAIVEPASAAADDSATFTPPPPLIGKQLSNSSSLPTLRLTSSDADDCLSDDDCNSDDIDMMTNDGDPLLVSANYEEINEILFSVPEPASLPAAAAGLATLAAVRRFERFAR